MKSIRTLTIAVLLLLAGTTAMANGDPVLTRSAVTVSKTPVAIHVPEVQIVNEQLLFVPNGLYTEVTVRYLLHNHSKKSFSKLAYGFPIDYLAPSPNVWSYGESTQELGWNDRYVKGVTFSLNGKELAWQCSGDTMVRPSERYIMTDYIDVKPDSAGTFSQKAIELIIRDYGHEAVNYNYPVMRRWFYTFLDLPAESYATLEVHYFVSHTHQELLYGSSHIFENNNSRYDECTMVYDFSPASYWGNGHADRLLLQIDTTFINPIRNYDTDGKGNYDDFCTYKVKLRDRLWSFEASNFDLAKAEPMYISFTNKQHLPQSLANIFNHRISPDRYTVTVSGADKSYPAANLSDLDPSTTTVLKPDKDGKTYITIKFKKPQKINGFFFFNGYTKSAESYWNNSKVDSLIVGADYYVVTEWEGQKDTDTVTPKNCLLCERDYSVKYTDWENTPAKYTGSDPVNFDWQSLTDAAMLINMQRQPDIETVYANEITIAISNVKKGKKYNDLCVSEIILVGD